MGIFHELGKKPWLIDHSAINNQDNQGAFFLPTGKVGLRTFLVVVSVVFTLLVVAYIDRMSFSGWRSVPEPWVLWLNTGLLIAGSFAMEWARKSARREDMAGVRDGLLWGGVLTFAFLTGQLFVWQQLVELGYYANSNSANAFFYLLTAVHGAHLLGGLVAWGRSVLRMRQASGVADVRLSVELCTTYWHYLLLIWLILFGLLLFS